MPKNSKTSQKVSYPAYQRNLRDAAKAWFERHCNEKVSNTGYSLASYSDWKKNIINDDVLAYIHENNISPLHRSLHHGLSSQAMTFNLIGPLAVHNDLSPLRDVFDAINVKFPQDCQIKFEYSDGGVFGERGQATSFDVAIIAPNDTPCVLFEVKLSESNFGGCSVFMKGECDGRNPIGPKPTHCRLTKLGRTYWEHVRKRDFHESTLFQGSICPFANFYQFFREVLFVLQEDNRTFVLLYDERNPAYINNSNHGESDRGLWPFLCESIPKSMQSRVVKLSIQDLVLSIEKSGRHDVWLKEFKDKYGLTALN